MRTIEVKQGQTFFDVVIEATGSISNAFEIAKKNNLSITENLSIGQKIIIPTTITKKLMVFSEGHYPASKENEDLKQINLEYVLPLTFPIL